MRAAPLIFTGQTSTSHGLTPPGRETISSTSVSFADHLRDARHFEVEPTIPFPTDLAKLSEFITGESQELAKEVQAYLSGQGISPQSSLSLRIDAWGRLRVEGDPSQAARVEESLASHPEISQRLERLARAHAVEQAAAKNPEFQRRFLARPSEALQDFAELLGQGGQDFQLNVATPLDEASLHESSLAEGLRQVAGTFLGLLPRL